jgi:haloalkane dehalogenase
VFVVHDWGSLLAFDWANRNRARVQGVAYMEAILTENKWSDFPEAPREAIRAVRSPAGDDIR